MQGLDNPGVFLDNKGLEELKAQSQINTGDDKK